VEKAHLAASRFCAHLSLPFVSHAKNFAGAIQSIPLESASGRFAGRLVSEQNPPSL
jgi:hypothetical protein